MTFGSSCAASGDNYIKDRWVRIQTCITGVPLTFEVLTQDDQGYQLKIIYVYQCRIDFAYLLLSNETIDNSA